MVYHSRCRLKNEAASLYVDVFEPECCNIGTLSMTFFSRPPDDSVPINFKTILMRSFILSILANFSLVACFCQTIKNYDTKDTRALNDVAIKWARFWNIHNADSMVALFSPDIDFVTKSGTWFRGKSATYNHQKKNHETVFKTSTWITDSISIKYVKQDVAIIHIGWGLSGDSHHDGTPSDPRHGMSTWVLIKENNEWLLLAIQNVNIDTPK